MKLFWEFLKTSYYYKGFSLINSKRFFNIHYIVKSSGNKEKSNISYEPPWKILFFGTDQFALESLKPLCAKLRTGTLLNCLGVVSKSGSIISNFAENEKIPIYIWPLKTSQICREYDIGVVVSFGNMIPEKIIKSLPLGCINIHASLLPRWRGASPIIHSVMNGDTESGVTVMRIHPHKFDVGEIVRQYRVPIHRSETTLELEKRLSHLGSQLLMECLRDLPRCIENAIPQPHDGITFAPKIKSSAAVVDWKTMDAMAIYNLHKAINHIYPLKTHWYGYTIKLLDIIFEEAAKETPRMEMKLYEEIDSFDLKKSALSFLNGEVKTDTKLSLKSEPGNKLDSCKKCDLSGCFQFIKSQKCIKVFCSDKRVLLIKKLSVSGKIMSSVDFYNGYLSKKDSSEWKFE